VSNGDCKCERKVETSFIYHDDGNPIKRCTKIKKRVMGIRLRPGCVWTFFGHGRC
jgi:hypothetical protein